MAKTTITVDEQLRNQLLRRATKRGMSINDLLWEFVGPPPTPEELAARHEATARYIREHLCPDLSDDEDAPGARFWEDLEAGRTPRL